MTNYLDVHRFGLVIERLMTILVVGQTTSQACEVGGISSAGGMQKDSVRAIMSFIV